MTKPARKTLLAAIVVALVLVSGGAFAGDGGATAGVGEGGTVRPEDVEKVQLLYFHPRFRCVSCNNIEKFAGQVAETDFEREMKDGTLEFESLQIDDPRNRAVVEELGVTGSSLYVVVTGGGEREHREIKSVWLSWDNPGKCREIISSEVAAALEGGDRTHASLPLSGLPVVLAAFILGLLTAMSPCPLATNIAALSYVSRRLESRKYTVLASVFYTAGRMAAYSLVGALLILAGLSAQKVSLFFQDYADMVLGPLNILFGLVMLDVLKLSIFKGRVTSAVQARIGDWGLPSSFLLGALFALAFCPYSAILFFGMLMPIALESAGGVTFPAMYGFGTGVPVMLLAFALSLGVSELGKHISRVQRFEKYFRRLAGLVFLGVGVYYLVVLMKSFFQSATL